ncbi:acylase [Candidatus Poribacteria bacterium]|nr:acylase [Candidatus Poribacteria bacterium]
MRRGIAIVSAICVAIGAVIIIHLFGEKGNAEAVPTGKTYDVRILRDTWGVPHIFGRTDADVAYGLAYAHAEDDFKTIQDSLLAARGQLASVYGRKSAPMDYLVHLLRIWDVVDSKYEADLSPETKAICEAYAAGLTRYAEQHPREVAPGLLPFRGKDIVAGFVQKVPLFFGLDSTLSKLYASKPAQSAPARSSTHALLWTPTPDAMTGSNTFAVSPARSADGKTRLAINSHQPWTGPVAWYETHLHSEEGWDMVGGVFPGSPTILHGHNRNLGWAHTVNRPDLIDVYVLEINPENPTRYKFDGSWRDLEVRSAPIKVKLLGPISWTFKKEVLWSVYGPVIRLPHGTYALRYAGMGDVRQVEQWYRMNKARNLDEWLDAMRIQGIPSFNCGYADREGNIYYIYNARLPLRAEGYDWSGYLPGNTSETLWTEYLPFDKLPQVKNPASGFFQNCNSCPFQTTIGSDNPKPESFSPTFGIETRMTNRALRALELFGSDESITEEEFYTYKYDVTYSKKSQVAQLVGTVLSAPRSDDPVVREAVEVLRAWDLRTNPENTNAAIAALTVDPILRAQYRDKQPPDVMTTFVDAAHGLKRFYGRIDVPWNQVNRLRRGKLDLGLGGGPDVLHAIHGKFKDGHMIGDSGECYVLMVTFDKKGVASRSIHQYGSATLDSKSPHYADQSLLFVKCEMKPVWLDESEIRAHLEREYRP